MLNLKEWKVDRYVRLISGIGLLVFAVFFKNGNPVILGIIGAVMMITALSNACPFNACAVKVPVKKEDR
jgi:hypothetical protein